VGDSPVVFLELDTLEKDSPFIKGDTEGLYYKWILASARMERKFMPKIHIGERPIYYITKQIYDIRPSL